MSNVEIVGRCTDDPELRFTTGGKAVVKFSVAENRKIGDGQEDRVSYFECEAWDKFAENIAATLKKGMRVIVTGRLEQQRWEKDGVNRSKIIVVVQSCGPDLRWAQATVDLIPYEGAGSGSSSGAGSSGRPSGDPIYGDEEPF